jgi:hypothetical protein
MGQLCDAGEKATFSCATDTGAKGCTASWLKDNKPLDGKMADKAKITAKENVFSLELSGVQSGDSGQYSCRVTDGNQVTITCSANLEVHGLSAAEKKARQDSQAPVYLVKLRESDLILESTAALMVHVHGNPNPAVEFLKDGKPLAEDARVAVNKDGGPNGSYEITIKKSASRRCWNLFCSGY